MYQGQCPGLSCMGSAFGGGWRYVDGTEQVTKAKERKPWLGPLLKAVTHWDREKARSRFRSSALLVLIAVVVAVTLRLSGYLQVLLLKSFAIVVLSYLPGWLFLRFLSIRARSVRDEYVLNLHRLGMDRLVHLPQPPRNSMYHEPWRKAVEKDRQSAGLPPLEADGEPDPSNVYLAKFDAHYGVPGGAKCDGDTLERETFFPVLLCTAILAVGWATVLHDDSLLALVPPATNLDLLRLAFVGAYLFILHMLLRRFFQSDMKASAYVNAIVRVLSALVLIAVLDMAMLADRPTYERVAAAFAVGFFPLVGLQALHGLGAVLLKQAVPSLRDDYPLSDLDGLSVWYEARLLELGIEDMENLATANLVDVTLHSRVPVGRMVDWVDQAHLYLHLEPVVSRRRQQRQGSSRRKLRRLGIRTATDLEAAFGPPCARTSGAVSLSDADNQALVEGLRWALNPWPQRGEPSTTHILLKTFRNAPNLVHVRKWREAWAEGDCTAENEVGARTAAAPTGPTGNGSTPPGPGLTRRLADGLAAFVWPVSTRT